MDWIEPTAVLFGVLCVWLTIRQNIWCWPTGLVQVILYIYIFYTARLYSDMLLHVIYVALCLYGWYYWLHGGRNHGHLAVSRLSRRGFAGWILVALLGAALLGYVMARYTNAALPYPDAFTTVASLVAQWLMARKRLESWIFWIVVDLVAIGVYINRELFLTAGLYGAFLILATAGLLTWLKSLQPQTSAGENHEDGLGLGQVCPTAPRTPTAD